VEIFIAHHAAQVSSTLSGFDRLVFRGTLLPLMPNHAMFHFLTRAGVRLLDFKDYVSQTSERVKAAALAEAEKQNRPVIYSESPKTSKEDQPSPSPPPRAWNHQEDPQDAPLPTLRTRLSPDLSTPRDARRQPQSTP